MARIDELKTIVKERDIEMVSKIHGGLKYIDRKKMTHEERLRHDVYIIAEMLLRFLRQYESTIKVLHFIYSMVSVLVFTSIGTLLLIGAYKLLALIVGLWNNTTPDTRFNSAWALVLIPISIIADRKWRNRTSKQKKSSK